MRYLLSILCSVISFASLAQMQFSDAEVEMGPELKANQSATSLQDIIGYDRTGFYALSAKGTSEYYLQHYDNDLKLTRNKKIELWENRMRSSPEFVLFLKGKLYVFTTLLNKKAKTNTFHMQEYDYNTFLPKAQKQVLAEINFEDFGKYNSGSFGFDLSPDSSKILVYYNLPTKAGENELFGVNVLDDSFRKVWSRQFRMRYDDNLFKVDDWIVSNKGDFYLVGTQYDEPVVISRGGLFSRRQVEQDFRWKIIKYGKRGEGREITVDLGDKFITDLKVVFDPLGDMLCSGFYSETGTYSIKGAFFMTIDAEDHTVSSATSKDFGPDVLLANKTKKEVENTKDDIADGDAELYEYDLDRIILRDDGGAILVGEQYYVQVVTTSYTDANGNRHTKTTYYYYYNDIIVVNLGPTGQIEWAERIPKRQVSANDGGFFSSYALTIANGKLYFVFNDNPKNLVPNSTGEVHYTRFRKSVVAVAELDLSGRWVKTALFNAADADVITVPKVCEQITDSQMIVFSKRKKKYRMSRVTF